MSNKYQTQFNEWISKEKKSIELITAVAQLWFERATELVIFRKPLHNVGSSEVLLYHQQATSVYGKEITIFDTTAIAQAILKLELAPSRIDIGRLALEWVNEKSKFANVDAFVKSKLADLIGKKSNFEPKDVVLYGFGRIGRIAARELITQAGKGEQLRLRAIVTRSNTDEDLVKRAELLRNDSVHGAFLGTIIEDFENKALIINGQMVYMIAANSPDGVDYTKFDIRDALLIDNTGIARDREGLGKHLLSKGISKVLLTAPGKGDISNIVFGINEATLSPEKETIYSAASCTTNAISPVLKVVEDVFGIDKGHIETVHSYTNDQNLLDNYHKKERRGRAAALNMVITETGADKAVAKVIPVLAGKLTGNAVRVPTPNVSLAILNLTLKTTVDKDTINAALRKASLESNLVEQIDYSISKELVSSDLIGNSHASIYDSPATIVSKDGKNVTLYVWYDNEYGYTRQVIRMSKYISGVIRFRYY